MKKLHLFLFVAALSCFVMGCRKPVEVSFGVESLNVTAEGGTYTAELKSNGDWTIGSTAEWLTVSPTSGNGNATLTFEVQPNTVAQSRSLEVRATTKDNTASLNIKQEGIAGYITLIPNSMLGDWEGGSFQVIVQANIMWTVTNLPEWMDCSKMEGRGDDTLLMTMHPFFEMGNREAFITFGDDNTSAQFHARQSGTSGEHVLSVTPDMFQVPYTGDVRTMTVTCDEAWVAVPEMDWISLDITEGAGSGEVVLTVAENPLIEARQTCIKFVSDSHNSVVVDIYQEGAPDPHFLDVAPTALNFEKGGGSQEIAVACDTEWTADFSGDWLSLSTTVGMGNGNLTITVAPNVYNEARQTFVAIASGNLTRRVMVAQEPGDEPLVASVSPDTLYVAQVGGVKMFEITSNTNWTLSAPSWITMPDVSGSGDATIEMMVDVNRTYSSRVGYITVMHNGMELSRVAIVQEGIPPILSVDVEEIVFTREGGTQYFNLTSNMSWTIENLEEWLVCSPTEGSGNTEVVVKAVPMDEVGSREVVLVIRGSLGQTVNVVVRQNS
ncbi:MAG: BACON domain-containing protein [Bacteroidales bacterium]|nr:BACON domain-containing protein [Bacteroidales bacterium]